MPMCGPRRRGYGSPHWSSSGSTERPPSSSGLHWRTSLQWAVVLDSSLSATLSPRMIGETINPAVACFKCVDVLMNVVNNVFLLKCSI